MEADSTSSPQSDAVSSKSRRGSILDFGPAGLLVASIAGSCGAWHWALDLCSHFRWYYFVISLIWVIAICRTNRRRSQSALALALIWNGVLLQPYYWPLGGVSVPESVPKLSLISVNVFTANQNKSAVVDYLRDRQPDMVFVIEVDRKWADALQTLSDIYPHIRIQDRPDNFGIGVLSKRALIEPRFIDFSGFDIPSIVTKIDLGSKTIQLVATHPLPPVGASNANERNTQLHSIAEFVKQSTLPTIVAGDLNATPWSVAFRDFVHQTGLRDSSLELGIHGTWNAKSLVRIPIDHVLIPPTGVVTKRTVGPNVGSDHFPLEVTVAFP